MLNSGTLRHEIGIIVLWAVAILIVFILGLQAFGSWHDEWSGYDASFSISDGVCNIAVVPILGEIIPYSGANDYGDESEPPISISAGDARAAIRMAESDPDIRGVLVYIDSYGGTPAAAESIANMLKGSPMPVAAYIGEASASAAYLVATGADRIFASPFSDIGSIGVTMSYVENWEQNTKEGLRYVSLASAPFKDYGDPNKPITAAERALLERDLKIYHEQFVKEVAGNRNLPVEDVAKLADGSSMPASLALENKLIDALSDQETPRAWFAEQLKMPMVEVVFCE